jgi:hypothetical protein
MLNSLFIDYFKFKSHLNYYHVIFTFFLFFAIYPYYHSPSIFLSAFIFLLSIFYIIHPIKNLNVRITIELKLDKKDE